MPTIAVGYDVPTTEIVEQICHSFPDFEKGKKYTLAEIASVVKSGIYYGKQCKGGLSDVIKNEEELTDWMKKRSRKEKITGYCSTIHANHYALVAEIYTDCGDRFFCILASTGTATTVHKHSIVNGTFGGVVHTLTKVEFEVKPYIF